MIDEKFGYSIVKDRFGKDVYAKTPNQLKMIELMDKSQILFVDGPAGTGKTFLAVAKAAAYIKSGKYQKIVLTRPAVEAGENLGFMPGELEDKFSHYVAPLYEYLNLFFPKAPREKVQGDFPSKYKKKKAKEPEKISQTHIDVNSFTKVIPLAFLRGYTLDDSIVIADESQNLSVQQMILLLTRLGKNSKMIIVGDTLQSDLRNGQKSGFGDAMNRLQNINHISQITFDNDDIQRNGILHDILVSYNM